MFKPRAVAALSLWLLTACLGGDTGTEGDEASMCESQRHVSPGEVTPVGTPNALAELATCEQTLSLTYWRLNDEQRVARTTTANVAIAALPSTARLLEGPSKDAHCPRWLAMDATLRIESEDGAFQEELSGELTALDSLAEPTFTARVPLTAIRGSYAAEDAGSASTLSVALSRANANECWRGRLYVSDPMFEVARW